MDLFTNSVITSVPAARCPMVCKQSRCFMSKFCQTARRARWMWGVAHPEDVGELAMVTKLMEGDVDCSVEAEPMSNPKNAPCTLDDTACKLSTCPALYFVRGATSPRERSELTKRTASCASEAILSTTDCNLFAAFRGRIKAATKNTILQECVLSGLAAPAM